MYCAINFVLLPSEEASKRIIKLNEELKRDYSPPRIVLGRDYLPHISLLMGIVENKDFPLIKKRLEEIARRSPGMNLKTGEFYEEKLPTKGRMLKIQGLSLIKSQELKSFQERLIQESRKYLRNINIRADMFYQPRQIDCQDTPWMFDYIKNFVDNSTGHNFNPHITIGDGDLKKEKKFSESLIASKLALSQVGSYCTCGKIIECVNI